MVHWLEEKMLYLSRMQSRIFFTFVMIFFTNGSSINIPEQLALYMLEMPSNDIIQEWITKNSLLQNWNWFKHFFFPWVTVISWMCGDANTLGGTPNSWTFWPPCFGSGFCYLSSGRLLHTLFIVNVAKLLNQNNPDKRFRNSLYHPVYNFSGETGGIEIHR